MTNFLNETLRSVYDNPGKKLLVYAYTLKMKKGTIKRYLNYLRKLGSVEKIEDRYFPVT